MEVIFYAKYIPLFYLYNNLQDKKKTHIKLI